MLALHSFPYYFGELTIRYTVFFREIKCFTLALPCIFYRILFVNVVLQRLCIKRRKIGRVGEQRHNGVAAASYWLIGFKPRISSMVLNTDVVEIHGMIDKSSLYKSTGNISGTAVCVHVVGTILGIVFQYKHHAFFPYRAFAQVVNKHAHSKIVIGTMRKRLAFLCSNLRCDR